MAAYLFPSSLEAEVLLLMAVVFGLSAIWYVKVLVSKLRAQMSPPSGPWGSNGSVFADDGIQFGTLELRGTFLGLESADHSADACTRNFLDFFVR